MKFLFLYCLVFIQICSYYCTKLNKIPRTTSFSVVTGKTYHIIGNNMIEQPNRVSDAEASIYEKNQADLLQLEKEASNSFNTVIEELSVDETAGRRDLEKQEETQKAKSYLLKSFA